LPQVLCCADLCRPVLCCAVQVLAMSTRDIDMLIRLWDKFKFGVDEQASC
jgi:hypothetical protein